jgi:hypothetical protein
VLTLRTTALGGGRSELRCDVGETLPDHINHVKKPDRHIELLFTPACEPIGPLRASKTPSMAQPGQPKKEGHVDLDVALFD